MTPVELVVSAGPYSAGKVTDDDCAFCDLFGGFNDEQDEEEEDLIVSASVSNSIPTPGQAFTLKARVQNQGTDAFPKPRPVVLPLCGRDDFHAGHALGHR